MEIHRKVNEGKVGRIKSHAARSALPCNKKLNKTKHKNHDPLIHFLM